MGRRRALTVLATLWVVSAVAACTFDGLDGYTGGDGSVDATFSDSLGDAPPDTAAFDGGQDANASDGSVQDACIGCLPIACGGGTCIAPAEICCGHFSDAGQLGNYQCTAPGNCAGGGDVPIACSGPESCGSNQVCCGDLGTNVGVCGYPVAKSTACHTSASCGFNQFLVGCDAGSSCGDGGTGTCINSTCTLPSFQICR